MGVIAKRNKSDYSTVPEGLYAAVCIDVIDLGIVKVTYKEKTKEQHMVKLRWMLDETDPKSGKNFWVSRRFNNSLSEKASLCKILESWRGRKFTEEELDGFDTDDVIGANCQVQVQHNLGSDGTTYANVVAVVKKAKGAPELMIPEDYVREKDRAHETDGNGNYNRYQAEDEDVPF